MSLDLADLHAQAPVSVWVEDRIARAYLAALWADPEIAILAAPSRHAADAIVRTLDRDNGRHIFAAIGKDIFYDGEAEGAPHDRIHVLPRPDLASYAVDVAAIAVVAEGHPPSPADSIAEEVASIAKRLTPLYAARLALGALVSERCGHWSGAPWPAVVADDWCAVGYIDRTPFATFHGGGDRWFDCDKYLPWRKHQERLRVARRDDRIPEAFPGLPILAGLAAVLSGRGRLAGPDPAASLAAAVGAEQRRAGRVPADLATLRRTLRERAGLAADASHAGGREG